MMGGVDVRAVAMLSQIGFMRLMQSSPFAGVLGVHSGVSRLMLGMELSERAMRSTVAFVLSRRPGVLGATFSAFMKLASVTSGLGVRFVSVSHLTLRLLLLVYLTGLASRMFSHG